MKSNFAKVMDKNSSEEMLMKKISLQKDFVSQKEKDAETISRLLANIERLMDELSEARAEISNLVSINSSKAEQIIVLKKHRYGSHSKDTGDARMKIMKKKHACYHSFLVN